MGTAIALWDVVGEAEYVFLIGIVPLHSQFDLYVVPSRVQIEHIFVQWCFIAIEVFDKSFDTALVLETIFFVDAFITQEDAYPGIQKRQLAQALSEHVIVEIDIAENGGAGLETDFGTGLLSLTDHSQRRQRCTKTVVLLVNLAITTNGQAQGFGQSVHHRHADPMQATGNLVGTVIELTTSVQHGHDHFGGRTSLGMLVGGNATTVVRYCHCLVAMNSYTDLGTVTR